MNSSSVEESKLFKSPTMFSKVSLLQYPYLKEQSHLSYYSHSMFFLLSCNPFPVSNVWILQLYYRKILYPFIATSGIRLVLFTRVFFIVCLFPVPLLLASAHYRSGTENTCHALIHLLSTTTSYSPTSKT